jgi:rhomboid protease GluP
MATGISARHSADIGITDMSPEEFLLIAIETANKLEWKLSEIYENGLKAYTSFSIISYGEEITIEISEGSAHILSECIGTQLYS